MYAKNGIPMYEGDGFIHPMQNPPQSSPENVAAEVELRDIKERARKLRRETIARLLRRLVAKLNRIAFEVRTAPLEKYLSRSSDLADVERRLRQAERDGRLLQG